RTGMTPMSELGVLRPPGTILLGAGAVSQAGRLAATLGQRVLICTDGVLAGSDHLSRLVRSLEQAGAQAEVLAGAVPELPLSAVAKWIATGRRDDPECVVGFGGGSCIDLAKLVALGLSAGLPLSRWYDEGTVPAPTLPVMAMPTTAGTGSEV